jgi:superfamily II DNA or RNA helicase
LGKGLRWKLCLTGTPAPNDRIEFANHGVFLDQFPTVNAFLARYFVNRGETANRWELKPHALRPFYRSLSHWCVFLDNPAVYGWKDNAAAPPPVRVHVHDIPLTRSQREAAQKATGSLFVAEGGGIVSRSKLSRIAKGDGAATHKTAFVRDLVGSWPGESTIVWCRFNAEQEQIAAALPGCASIDGKTPDAERAELVADFQAGRRKVLVSKAKILGFGLNLQVCTRMVFSGLSDSWEEYHQAVKRANRTGSSRPLDVHIPLTELERPMLENVLRKADRVQRDTEEQELIFKESRHAG